MSSMANAGTSAQGMRERASRFQEESTAKAARPAAEPTMRAGGTDASELPRLDAFDEEFGREPVAILRGQQRKGGLRFSTFVVLLLGAGIISAMVLAWFNAEEWLHFEVQPAPSSPQLASREGSDTQIGRLRREIDALKKEIGQLTEAQQQAADTIASLKAAGLDSRDGASSAYWYSDLAALHYGIASPPRPGTAAPAPPRSATARPEFRNSRRRDGGAPLSLEAPQ
jgi:hypothetical protein